MPVTNAASPSRPQWLPLALLLLAAASATYFFWPRISGGNDRPVDPAVGAEAVPDTRGATGSQTTPDGRIYAGEGIEVDANGARILNEAGLPKSAEPLPAARPIPIKAAPSEVIGYARDAQGVVKPIKAGELAAIPNSPGTYAVVDMWAEGGPAVVPATKGTALSPQELARLREAEARSERTRR